MTLFALILPFCLSPMFIVPILKLGASSNPLELFPIIKSIYCKALKSEGLNVDEKYIYNPFLHEWYLNKKSQNFFKKNLLEKKIHKKNYSNYNYVHSTNYNIYIRENYSNKDINDIVSAIRKIDSIFKI